MASVSKNRQGKWVTRWRDAQDRQHSKVIPGPKANALKLKADIEARQALGHLYEAEPETLGVYLEGWLGRETQRVRPSTVQRRREALRGLGVLDERGNARAETPHAPRSSSLSSSEAGSRALTRAKRGDAATSSHLASEYLHRITAAEIEDAVLELAARAPRQAQMALAALKGALKNAATRGQDFDRRILELKAPRYQEREARFLTWDEVQRLASWMPEHVKRIVPVAALTGLRQGELFGLMETDLDLGNACLSVRRSGAGPTKTKASERTVHLPALAVELLREQLLARRALLERTIKLIAETSAKEARLQEQFRKRDSDNEALLAEIARIRLKQVGLRKQRLGLASTKLVFPAPFGGPWKSENLMARIFRPALRRAGLEPMGFHGLRHTFVSLAALSGVRIEHIAAQLGHADGGSLLLSRYRHLFPQELADAALKLDALVRSGQGLAAEANL